jgi:hypothetical protein
MSEEELESIPWATLIEGARTDRSRLIYLAAGAIIVFALAALAARTLWTPATTDVAVAADPVPNTVAVTTSAPPPAAPALFSEADLMASLDAESTRAAVAFAEWFVYDYFTVDGDPATLASIQDALPPGIPEDLLPHASNEMVTYVEWARAARVTELTPGIFEVLVLFRTVAAPNGETFERQPMRAVLVPMEMGAAGGLRLTDLPSPAHVPSRPEVGQWVAPDGPGSPELGGVATVLSWPGLGTDLEPIAASRVGDRWRILVINHLPAGTGWPFVITASDELVSG